MNISKVFQEMSAEIFGKVMGRIVPLYANGACIYRASPSRKGNKLREIDISGVKLREQSVVIDGYQHLVTLVGNERATEEQTLVMMGGIPTDSSETFHWLAADLCNRDSALRCIIVHLPFTEPGTPIVPGEELSRHNAKRLPFGDGIDCSHVLIDTRFDHRNQAITAYEILLEMEIRKAHFVGHDRGAVVFDYLISDHPVMALSYSRGAQLWDYYDEAWGEKAPELIVGPPHRFMAVPWQSRFLFFMIVARAKPIQIFSSGFKASARNAKRGTEGYDRATHLMYEMLKTPDSIFQKLRQAFMQTDSTFEVKSREALKNTSVPIMQFQGEDEFAFNKQGTLVSDQPYFGRYNLFRNEVEDLYPGAQGQDADKKRDELLDDRDEYRLLAMKPDARMSRFALIPNSAHFNVVENPSGCAAAIFDFIQQAKP